MSAPFRVQPLSLRSVAPFDSGGGGGGAAPAGGDAFRNYLDRLLKLIPGEIVGLYIVGSGLIPEDRPFILVGWFVFCSLALVLVRVKGTADPETGLGAQKGAVIISLVSFIIWIYSLGGPFKAFPSLDIHEPTVGSLMILGWTFIVPFFYRGSNK